MASNEWQTALTNALNKLHSQSDELRSLLDDEDAARLLKWSDKLTKLEGALKECKDRYEEGRSSGHTERQQWLAENDARRQLKDEVTKLQATFTDLQTQAATIADLNTRHQITLTDLDKQRSAAQDLRVSLTKVAEDAERDRQASERYENEIKREALTEIKRLKDIIDEQTILRDENLREDRKEMKALHEEQMAQMNHKNRGMQEKLERCDIERRRLET